MQHSTDQSPAFGVVILAAGSSQRMGRPKLLLLWGSNTVLGHLIKEWTWLKVRQIVVVCARDSQEIQQELHRLIQHPTLDLRHVSPVFNPAPDRGMFSSVQIAANWPGWNSSLTHWIITLGDQPHLKRETLRALLDFGAAHPDNICRPLRAGRGKHPVLLPRGAFLELKNSPASDLKTFLEAHAADLAGFESEDAGLDLDMDTPEDYERLKGI